MSTQTTRTLWEVPYISSKSVLNVNDSTFSYQLVLRGVEKSSYRGDKQYFSVSRIKVFPVSVVVNNCEYKFTQKASSKVSWCYSNNNKVITVNWREGSQKKSVLTLEELNPEEQLNQHLVMLEKFIEQEFLPDIYLKF